MKRFIVSLLLAASFTGANAQATDTAKVRQLVTILHTDQMMSDVMVELENNFRNKIEGLDSIFFVELHELADLKAFRNKLIPIYANNYTDKEIDQLITFYNTPLGRKVNLASTRISTESIGVLQTWGKDLTAVLGRRWQERMEIKKNQESYKNHGPVPPPPPIAPPPPPPMRGN